jgi:hypothetical protein
VFHKPDFDHVGLAAFPAGGRQIEKWAGFGHHNPLLSKAKHRTNETVIIATHVVIDDAPEQADMLERVIAKSSCVSQTGAKRRVVPNRFTLPSAYLVILPCDG